MANPLFSGPMGQMMQVVNTVRQIKQNPNQLGQFLKEHNKINDAQLKDINKMGGNFDQIGNYLINNNIMSQQDATQLYQGAYPQIQQALMK